MEAKRKSALSDFFKVKQISAHDRLSFFGLMVKPVQRFPQFILFLQVSHILRTLPFPIQSDLLKGCFCRFDCRTY